MARYKEQQLNQQKPQQQQLNPQQPQQHHPQTHFSLQSEQITIEETKQILEKLFDDLQQMQKNLPYTHDPPGLKTRLLPYQRQGLGWMQRREHPEVLKNGTCSLFWEWREAEKIYHNVITNAFSHFPPDLPKGGILADEMGLGKTIQIISLILCDPKLPPVLHTKDIPALSDLLQRPLSQPQPQPQPQSQPQLQPPETSAAGASKPPSAWGKTTLIVCPLTVVGNWVTQIEAHVEPGRLQVYVFHGANRNTDSAFLLQHDVVITTYQVLAGDYQKDTFAGLLTIPWLRVVLDEAHSIKSKQAKQSMAAACLRAERRWCITGTPLQNSLDDLFSLVRFLHISPFDDNLWWTKVFARPLKSSPKNGIQNLQALLQHLCLRRVKNMEINGKPIVVLPKRNLYLCKIKFSPEELEQYKLMEEESARTLKEYIEGGKLADNYSHVLIILTRLRQFCDHPSLCTAKDTTLRKDEELFTILRDNECEDCAICKFQITNPVITPVCFIPLCHVSQVCCRS